MPAIAPPSCTACWAFPPSRWALSVCCSPARFCAACLAASTTTSCGLPSSISSSVRCRIPSSGCTTAARRCSGRRATAASVCWQAWSCEHHQHRRQRHFNLRFPHGVIGAALATLIGRVRRRVHPVAEPEYATTRCGSSTSPTPAPARADHEGAVHRYPLGA